MMTYEQHCTFKEVLEITRIHIDVAGSLGAGLILDTLINWTHKGNDPHSEEKRPRTFNSGRWWYSVPRKEWERIGGLPAKQVNAETALLVRRGLITTRTFKSELTDRAGIHMSLNKDAFMAAVNKILKEAR